MTPSLSTEAQDILKRLGVSARKKLGQNFMVDPETLKLISSAIPIKKGESVLEIGPGLGFLTRELLAQGAHVTAVEMDRAYALFLPVYFKEAPFALQEQDFLQFDLMNFFGTRRGKVFGNIPYHITSPILEKLIDARHVVSDAVLTVQWEVAQRICSEPGTKQWGPLSIFVQFYAHASLVKKISRQSFSPSPKVDSAILHLRLNEAPVYPVKDEKLFFSLVKKAFSKRRKTLLNALEGDGAVFLKSFLRTVLEKVGMDASRRPETLTLLDWTKLTDHFFIALQSIQPVPGMIY